MGLPIVPSNVVNSVTLVSDAGDAVAMILNSRAVRMVNMMRNSRKACSVLGIVAT
jgi:uncharacterized protein YgbK (DUF1537 family)